MVFGWNHVEKIKEKIKKPNSLKIVIRYFILHNNSCLVGPQTVMYRHTLTMLQDLNELYYLNVEL